MTRRPLRLSIEKLQLQVDDWNLRHPEGTPVTLTLDSVDDSKPARTVETATRSKAWLMGGHTPMIYVDRVDGIVTSCWMLDRVAPR